MKNYFIPIYILAVVGLACLPSNAIAQTPVNVSINYSGVPADVKALLDVSATDKGILIPRVALTTTSSNAPIGSGIPTSLLVYNIATASDVIPGYYYWNSTKWVSLSGGNGGLDWSLTGNSGTNASTNFLGTTDAVNLIIKTNNANRIAVLSGGNVGIGTTSPNTILDINGGLSLRATTLAAISGYVHNYNIGMGTTFRIKGSSTSHITGITGGYDGKIIIIRNVGPTYSITLDNESASSIAANRFTLSEGIFNVCIRVNHSVTLQYDATSQRWYDIAYR